MNRKRVLSAPACRAMDAVKKVTVVPKTRMLGMTLAFLIYSVIITAAIFAVSVYLFAKDMPSSGIAVLFISFFSAMMTLHILGNYSRERMRIVALRQSTELEVVVVPSLIIRGRPYTVGLPKDSPSTQHAQ